MSARIPSDRRRSASASSTTPSAGCATRVSVSAAACATRASRVVASGGKIVEASRGASARYRWSGGNAMNRSASIPGRWLPCPEKRSAICPPAPSRRTNTPPRSAAPRVEDGSAASEVNERARRSFSRRSSREVATIASCTGPSARRLRSVTARDRSASLSVGAEASSASSRSICRRAPARSGAWNRNSSAGHRSSPEAGASAPSYAARTAWKLVPPNPKALTPALRLSAGHGRATSPNVKGLASAS